MVSRGSRDHERALGRAVWRGDGSCGVREALSVRLSITAPALSSRGGIVPTKDLLNRQHPNPAQLCAFLPSMRVLSVSDFVSLVNETLKALSEADVFAVEGEVSQYRVSQGQWVSFDLKDDQALVNVFLPVWKLGVPLEDGMKVRVYGLGRVYPKYGKFSLSAEKIELVGEGALFKARVPQKT